MEQERLTDWMQIYSGRAFYPLEPREEDIDIVDIAHALSRQCRYAGHIEQEHYSVAEHCVLISLALPEEYALAGLLHDAAEAYLVDVPRPIKSSLHGYTACEATLERVVFEKFGLSLPMPAIVKEYDTRILHDEQKVLMKSPPMPWNIPGGPLGVEIHCWSADIAKQMFLMRFDELYNA